ncbi:hypothetical protein CONCODRAFT_3853 [Conidiobolus coronatus NRRL 28638]|uniref:Uncharacterized protein n=1 Tax=Conidiobolus coronatus (strain ATCC 28846 / CBS 209.66 / NRRL 28638) TaxID=796925 RepID=A0A137PDW0_CONC2|nr:hypothetical protein CONCODRAFT_3853 [Conidiobolus coronatus NRRL 28638]|eukprot:KXN73188.1 hypothetical protein CONCODRAFT_3853 [Conidiobolus coronatus NRRL 28638]
MSAMIGYLVYLLYHVISEPNDTPWTFYCHYFSWGNTRRVNGQNPTGKGHDQKYSWDSEFDPSSIKGALLQHYKICVTKSAADQLNKAGHSVTTYDRNDCACGLLMYGILNELKSTTFSDSVFCHNYLCYKCFVLKKNKLIGITNWQYAGYYPPEFEDIIISATGEVSFGSPAHAPAGNVTLGVKHTGDKTFTCVARSCYEVSLETTITVKECGGKMITANSLIFNDVGNINYDITGHGDHCISYKSYESNGVE